MAVSEDRVNWRASLTNDFFCRGTLDGGMEKSQNCAGVYHRLCDDQGPTMTVVQTTTGRVFGGYATTPVSTKYTDTPDPMSFVFGFPDGKRTHSEVLPKRFLHR